MKIEEMLLGQGNRLRTRDGTIRSDDHSCNVELMSPRASDRRIMTSEARHYIDDASAITPEDWHQRIFIRCGDAICVRTVKATHPNLGSCFGLLGQSVSDHAAIGRQRWICLRSGRSVRQKVAGAVSHKLNIDARRTVQTLRVDLIETALHWCRRGCRLTALSLRSLTSEAETQQRYQRQLESSFRFRRRSHTVLRNSL